MIYRFLWLIVYLVAARALRTPRFRFGFSGSDSRPCWSFSVCRFSPGIVAAGFGSVGCAHHRSKQLLDLMKHHVVGYNPHHPRC